jgi:hypothetical protein
MKLSRDVLFSAVGIAGVVRFSPRWTAAPFEPPTRPFASSSAFKILSRSASLVSGNPFAPSGTGAALPISSGIAIYSTFL